MSLPKEKIDRLADGLANDIKKVVREHYDNARKHEVGFEDAQQIVREGYRKAGEGKLSARFEIDSSLVNQKDLQKLKEAIEKMAPVKPTRLKNGCE